MTRGGRTATAQAAAEQATAYSSTRCWASNDARLAEGRRLLTAAPTHLTCRFVILHHEYRRRLGGRFRTPAQGPEPATPAFAHAGEVAHASPAYVGASFASFCEGAMLP